MKPTKDFIFLNVCWNWELTSRFLGLSREQPSPDDASATLHMNIPNCSYNQYKCIRYLSFTAYPRMVPITPFPALLSRANVNFFHDNVHLSSPNSAWKSPTSTPGWWTFVFSIEPWTGGLDCTPQNRTLTLASPIFQKNFRLWRFLTVQSNVNTPHEILYEIRHFLGLKKKL